MTIEQRIQKVVLEMFQQNRIAGMSVAVTDRKRVLFASGFGVDSVERPHISASAESVYRIASITKMVTGTVLMKLAEEKRLDLDVPVKQYVPWLAFSDPAIAPRMTLRHLLSHTAGLPAEYTPNGPRDEAALEPSLREALFDLPFHALPGENVYLYSNWGIRLASLAAEKITGRPFSELAREWVLEPLEMNLTTFDLRQAATYPLSLPHEEDEEGNLRVVHYINENAARLAAGGLYSNVFDLAKFARFLLNNGKNDGGETVLKPESVAMMRRLHAVSDAFRGDGYGLTTVLRKYRDRHLIGHMGSAPPYALSLFCDPRSGYGVITLMNTQRDELRYTVPETVLDHLLSEIC